MRRLATVAAMVLATAMLATPATGWALLSNDYGLTFAGQKRCLDCHVPRYAATTHSAFATAAAEPTSGATGMWPAGRPGIGESVNASDVAFTLGGGTGLREYLRWLASDVATAPGPVKMLNGLEWNPEMPSIWELASAGVSTGSYTCGGCHHLGWQRAGYRPASGNGSSAATATRTGWALDPADDRAVRTSWAKGASIQCESCHGTGVSAESSASGHWDSGVKVVGGWANGPNGQLASRRVLESQVCGQCHGSFKSGGTFGFTPDTTLTDFVTPFGFDAVPDRTLFETSSGVAASAKFWPSGQNKTMKHSYYAEWTLSAHSHRGALTSASPAASMFQKADIGHFSTARAQTYCIRCHTGEGYLKRKGAKIVAEWAESTKTAGALGQECAVCHYPHKADGSGLGVREPDGVGVGSNAGTTNANESMCEDCHNWQKEVEGTTLVPTTSGRGPSHPQREIRHARGMFDVAPTPAFMEGVACEECHMPATKSDFPNVGIERHDDRSYKRYSHRMLVMMPGDAKKWGLAPWGDSCSPCHPSVPQAELQESIETWQAQVSAAATLAANAITAAGSRPESATAAGKELLGRAYINHRFFLNDASKGAHNPRYLTAGLTKAAFMANAVGGAFGPVLSPSAPVAPGTLSAIAGSVRLYDGSAAAGGSLVLESLSGGSWTEWGRTTADANGNFVFLVAPTATTSYRVRWDRSSAPVTALYSPTSTITMALIKTSVTISRNYSSILLGRTVTLRGVASPAGLAGRSVRVDVVKPGAKSWSVLSYRVVGAGGAWSHAYKPTGRGSWRFRVAYPGDATYAPFVSGSVYVTVK